MSFFICSSIIAGRNRKKRSFLADASLRSWQIERFAKSTEAVFLRLSAFREQHGEGSDPAPRTRSERFQQVIRLCPGELRLQCAMSQRSNLASVTGSKPIKTSAYSGSYPRHHSKPMSFSIFQQQLRWAP